MAKTKTHAENDLTTPSESTYPPMELDVRIHRINPSGYIRANASVTMNGCFGVKNIKVMDSSKGIYVSMPSYTVQSTGEWREHCFPVTKEFREQLHTAVLDAYHQALTQSHESSLQGQPQPEYVPPMTPPFDLDEPDESGLESDSASDPDPVHASAMSGVQM